MERYTAVAPVYHLVSLERPVYRTGRVLGIPLLRLAPGDSVLDVGCGTGLNHPLLAAAVGATGRVVGVDSSAEMLRVADRRAVRSGWSNVRLAQHDATRLPELARSDPSLLPDPVDAVLFTYALSLMRPWGMAWRAATALARPGARVVVVDMAVPRGHARPLAPLARLACALGGADISAHPWGRLAAECTDVSRVSARGGHVQVWAGTWPGAAGPERGRTAP